MEVGLGVVVVDAVPIGCAEPAWCREPALHHADAAVSAEAQLLCRAAQDLVLTAHIRAHSSMMGDYPHPGGVADAVVVAESALAVPLGAEEPPAVSLALHAAEPRHGALPMRYG